VALFAAEAAVQVCGLAVGGCSALFTNPSASNASASCERDDVAADGLVGVLDAFRQAEDEVAR
jgi:hypothetical protein